MSAPGPEYVECVNPDCEQHHFVYGGKSYYTKLPSQLVRNAHEPTAALGDRADEAVES